MSKHVLHDLAEGLDQGTISRGQTLQLAGAALLGTLFGGVFAPPAGARSSSQRKAKNEDDDRGPDDHQHRSSSRSGCCPRGTFRTTTRTSRGECQCASIAFAGGTTIPCEGRSCCACAFTIEGEGFCIDAGCAPLRAGEPCLSSSQCQPGTKCVINTQGGTSCEVKCPSTH